ATPGSASLTIRCASASPATYPRFASDASIPAKLPPTTVADFFGLRWGLGPPGTHTIFLAFTAAGSLADGVINLEDIVALATKQVTVAPCSPRAHVTERPGESRGAR